METRTFPGFIDVHVHFRDPGVPEAETTESGLAAARAGGVGAVVTMPNTSPAVDSVTLLDAQRTARDAFAAAHPGAFVPLILPSAAITRGRAGAEVADLETLAEGGAAFFTDDGSYVADARVMEEAMRRVADLNMVVCEHAMDPQLLAGGVIRDCPLARRLALPVISPEVETEAIRRDLSLCRETGCRLHIQHISTAGGVELVRQAQREGLPVTAEATPHHLLLCCEDIPADDANWKMAPPLGNREDRAALREAVKDGVLFFATDHAPHPAAKKSLGFLGSANGIVGLECAIAVTYGVMVEEEGMRIDDWASAWCEMPLAILSKASRELAAARPATTVEFGGAWSVDVGAFASRSRNCPYDGLTFGARPISL